MINREKLEEALNRCQENEEGSFFCLADADTFLEAAREYAKILPHLEKMIEARKLATQTEWEFEKGCVYADDSAGSAICKCDLSPILRNPLNHENNGVFIATAANEISAIMKEIGDE